MYYSTSEPWDTLALGYSFLGFDVEHDSFWRLGLVTVFSLPHGVPESDLRCYQQFTASQVKTSRRLHCFSLYDKWCSLYDKAFYCKQLILYALYDKRCNLYDKAFYYKQLILHALLIKHTVSKTFKSECTKIDD